jgi:beta-lactam-binding protein with PASTA domain
MRPILRLRERGGAIEVVLGSVALAIALVALVVALTREPGSQRTAPSSGSPSKSLTTPTARVPAVVGMSQEDARRIVADAGLRPLLTTTRGFDAPAGLVVRETPTGGSRVSPDSNVFLVVSTGTT